MRVNISLDQSRKLGECSRLCGVIAPSHALGWTEDCSAFGQLIVLGDLLQDSMLIWRKLKRSGKLATPTLRMLTEMAVNLSTIALCAVFFCAATISATVEDNFGPDAVVPEPELVTKFQPVRKTIKKIAKQTRQNIVVHVVHGQPVTNIVKQFKPTYKCVHSRSRIKTDRFAKVWGEDSYCSCSDGKAPDQKWSNDQVSKMSAGVPEGWNNGCGGTGKNAQVWAAKKAFPDSFQSCCAAHDVGYADCSQTKKGADEAFANCLIEKAKNEDTAHDARGADPSRLPTYRDLKKKYAKLASRTWFSVWKHNAEFFDAKQYENCNCKPSEE